MATKHLVMRDLDEVKTVVVGCRVLLPPLIVVRHAWREVSYHGVEQTVHDYEFKYQSDCTWRVEYSGRHYFHWKVGSEQLLTATVKEQQWRWRCTVIKRPVQTVVESIPLFER